MLCTSSRQVDIAFASILAVGKAVLEWQVYEMGKEFTAFAGEAAATATNAGDHTSASTSAGGVLTTTIDGDTSYSHTPVSASAPATGQADEKTDDDESNSDIVPQAELPDVSPIDLVVPGGTFDTQQVEPSAILTQAANPIDVMLGG